MTSIGRIPLRWTNDPLYGWCNKNKKPDGNPYNLYTDGSENLYPD